MAVAIIMDFEGATLEQYDRIIELMGLEPGGDTPPGAMFHWVTEADDGLRVVDVWETEEAFDKFAAEQIGPFTEQVGITAPPQTTRHQVHNHLVSAG